MQRIPLDLITESRAHIPFYVTKSGRLMAGEYIDGRGRKRKPRMIAGWVDHKGYVRVNNRTFVTPFLHRIVAAVFIGYEPDKQINHIDGDKLNNAVDNLEWVTCKENINHAIDAGLRVRIDPKLHRLGGFACRGKKKNRRNKKAL